MPFCSYKVVQPVSSVEFHWIFLIWAYRKLLTISSQAIGLRKRRKKLKNSVKSIGSFRNGKNISVRKKNRWKIEFRLKFFRCSRRRNMEIDRKCVVLLLLCQRNDWWHWDCRCSSDCSERCAHHLRYVIEFSHSNVRCDQSQSKFNIRWNRLFSSRDSTPWFLPVRRKILVPVV